MDLEQQIKQLLKQETGLDRIILEQPPHKEMGDYAFPCFQLTKKLSKSPQDIAIQLSKQIKKPEFINSIQVKGPYLNFFVNHEMLAKDVLIKIYKEKNNYGKQNIGNNKTIIIDFSSPNIAKPFSIGHLRSTVIGNSLYQIFNFLGYKSIGINHLGDWGTQFGKLIFAYKKWGNKEKLNTEPIKYLLELYVKFHKESGKDESLSEKAKQEFQKLETNDKGNLKLWKIFKKLSLKEFEKIYSLLNIKFDSYCGESFYNSKIKDTVNAIENKKLAKKSQGALIIDLKKYNMPPLILVKSNKTSGYQIRDLTAVFYRLKKYKPEKILYITGLEQKLHFKQLFKTLELFGIDRNKFIHVDFGLFRFPKGKMSTRQGNIIFLQDVLKQATKKAEKIIQEKNPSLNNKKEIAKQIGIGSIIFGDLVNDRTKNIEFNWDKILSFEGETAPYLQYTHARSCSILEKAKKEYKIKPSIKINFEEIKTKEEIALIKRLNNFPKVLIKSAETYKPSYLANYLIDLAKEFNEFYNNCKVLSENKEEMRIRLLLVDSVKQILNNGLNLLGIQTPEKM